MKNVQMRNQEVAIILGIICFILTIGICIQIKSVDSITEKKGISISDNSGLIDEVFRQRQIYKDSYKELEIAEAELEKIRSQVTEHTDVDSSLEAQIKKNNKLLGLTEVKGPGIIIKLDDNRDIKHTIPIVIVIIILPFFKLTSPLYIFILVYTFIFRNCYFFFFF